MMRSAKGPTNITGRLCVCESKMATLSKPSKPVCWSDGSACFEGVRECLCRRKKLLRNEPLFVAVVAVVAVVVVVVAVVGVLAVVEAAPFAMVVVDVVSE